MTSTTDLIMLAQDHQSLYSSLLMILEALETGKMPKNFLMYNDEWLDGTMQKIISVMHEKYGIEVPDGEV